MSRRQPAEAKVKMATVGAGAGAVVSNFLIWLLDQAMWNGDADPAVPFPVAAFVALAVTAGLTYAAGWQAPHTPRSPE